MFNIICGFICLGCCVIGVFQDNSIAVLMGVIGAISNFMVAKHNY